MSAQPSNSDNRYDIIIVGGGIIGLLSALNLRRSGASVCVIERGALGGESSWAGGGIISPLYPWRYNEAVNVLAERSKLIYPVLVNELEALSGIDAQLLTTGMLILHDEEIEVASAWAKAYDVELHHLLSHHELQQQAPGIAARYQRGLWMPAIGQVRNPLLVQALRESCRAKGVIMKEHCAVDDILIENGRAQGVEASGHRLSADVVVIASGAWSGRVLQGRAEIDVHPVKGQMIMLKTEPGTVNTMVMDHGHYIIPRKDGHVLAGSTLEFTGFDKTVTEDAKSDLFAQACELMPLLGEYEVIRHWSGLRPGTTQGVPYICEHDEVAGLYIHAGHFRNGIVLGAASAELLAQMVTSQQTFCDISPYRLDAVH